jgi:hypothetical protein
MKGKPFFLFMFLLFSALLSSYLLLLFKAPGFNVSRHSFTPSPALLALLAALIFGALVLLWALYGRVVSRLSDRTQAEVLEQDF